MWYICYQVNFEGSSIQMSKNQYHHGHSWGQSHPKGSLRYLGPWSIVDYRLFMDGNSVIIYFCSCIYFHRLAFWCFFCGTHECMNFAIDIIYKVQIVKKKIIFSFRFHMILYTVSDKWQRVSNNCQTCFVNTAPKYTDASIPRKKRNKIVALYQNRNKATNCY